MRDFARELHIYHEGNFFFCVCVNLMGKTVPDLHAVGEITNYFAKPG